MADLMAFEVGECVQATGQIYEDDFLGRPKFMHAKTGDLGHVLELDGAWVTVRWTRNQTVTDCHMSELSAPCALQTKIRI